MLVVKPVLGDARMAGWPHRDAGDLLRSQPGEKFSDRWLRKEPNFPQSMANDVAPGVVEAIDVDGVVRRIDIQAVVERVDLNAALENVDLNAILAHTDLDRLLARLDLDALFRRVDMNEIQSGWTSTP